MKKSLIEAPEVSRNVNRGLSRLLIAEGLLLETRELPGSDLAAHKNGIDPQEVSAESSALVALDHVGLHTEHSAFDSVAGWAGDRRPHPCQPRRGPVRRRHPHLRDRGGGGSRP